MMVLPFNKLFPVIDGKKKWHLTEQIEMKKKIFISKKERKMTRDAPAMCHIINWLANYEILGPVQLNVVYIL